MGTARQRMAAAFERASVLVERLDAVVGDDDDAGAIMRKARRVIHRLGEAERIAILDAHPRIGAPAAALSALSRAEQGTDADAATLRLLAELNDAYERRFGFRFVVFVAGRPKAELVPVLRARLARERAEELATGMAEFLAIARDRLARTSG